MKQSLENMNIALVHDWVTNVAGGEKVVLELHKIFPDAPLFTSVYDPSKAKPFADMTVNTSILQNIPFMKSKREILIPFTPIIFEQFNLSKYDLVISSCSMASKGVITKPHTIHISYCHTPPRYLWDADLDPRAKKGKFALLRNHTVHKMRIWDQMAAERVDYYIANSEYVASRIKKYYKKEAIVIYPPVNTEKFVVSNDSEIGDYFLYVGRLVDYKRCDIVIKAFNDLKLPLKIIGRGPDKEKLTKMAKSNIEFLGHLSDEDIVKYYSRAKAFVFAAEEDFGIVPVEAMASGRPVIAYAKGGVAESVIDGETGVLFDEQTPQCLIEAVRNFDTEKFDSKKIKIHSEKFSAKRFRKEFEETVEKILKNHTS